MRRRFFPLNRSLHSLYKRVLRVHTLYITHCASTACYSSHTLLYQATFLDPRASCPKQKPLASSRRLTMLGFDHGGFNRTTTTKPPASRKPWKSQACQRPGALNSPFSINATVLRHGDGFSSLLGLCVWRFRLAAYRVLECRVWGEGSGSIHSRVQGVEVLSLRLTMRRLRRRIAFPSNPEP